MEKVEALNAYILLSLHIIWYNLQIRIKDTKSYPNI